MLKKQKLLSIEWNVGKTGVFTPKVHIVLQKLTGTTVSCFTGFNANYLMEKGIGEGATNFSYKSWRRYSSNHRC